MSETKNHLALVLAQIQQLDETKTLRDLSDAFEKIKRENPSRFGRLATSQSSLSRLIKKERFSLDRQNLWAEAVQKLLADYGMLDSGQSTSDYLGEVGRNTEVQKKAMSLQARRHATRQSGELNWEPVSHLFGIWQTINLSTYFERQEDASGSIHFRSGLRFIGPHEEATPDRLRLKIFDLGKTTIWEGSADRHQEYIYMRLREVSGRPHTGERMYNIYGDPSTRQESYKKMSKEYVTGGVVQVVVRDSPKANISNHLFYGISVIRYLPNISERYMREKILTRKIVEEISIDDKDKYCFRLPIDDVDEISDSGDEQFHILAKIIEWIKKPPKLERISDGCFTLEIPSMLI